MVRAWRQAVVLAAAVHAGTAAFNCTDSHVRPNTGKPTNVEGCETFCVIAHYSNSFLSFFLGVDEAACYPMGCAKLDEEGNYINDAAERVGAAASGEIKVFGCSADTFFEMPEGLQVTNSSGLPCNYYNPQSYDGVLDEGFDNCLNLPLLVSDESEASWFAQNLQLGIFSIVGGIVFMIVACCFVRYKVLHKRGKSADLRDVIVVKEGLSFKHVVGLVYTSASTILLLVILSAVQPFLLIGLLQVDTGELGVVSGKLSLADEIVSFAFLGIAGVASDFFGRRTVIVLGYLCISVSLVAMPHAGEVFPNYLLIRLIFAVGGALIASMLTALLSEIVAPKTLGIAAGVMGVSSGVGALIGVFVFAGMIPANYCIASAYYSGSALAFFSALVAFFLLPSKALIDKLDDIDEQKQTQTAKSLVVESLRVLAKSPRLAVAYFGGLLARGGSILVSAFIALWVARTFEERDLCVEDNESIDESTCGEDLLNPEKRTCPDAFTRASRISGTAQSFSLIAALVVGYLAYRNRDKPAHVPLGIAAAFSVVAYGVTPLAPEPEDTLMYLFAFGWGVAEISVIVLAQIAIAQQMQRYPQLRGTIAGTFSMVGSLGIVIVTNAGGALFDAVDPTAPFVFMGGLSAVLLAACVALVIYERKNGAPEENELDDNAELKQISVSSSSEHEEEDKDEDEKKDEDEEKDEDDKIKESSNPQGLEL